MFSSWATGSPPPQFPVRHKLPDESKLVNVLATRTGLVLLSCRVKRLIGQLSEMRKTCSEMRKTCHCVLHLSGAGASPSSVALLLSWEEEDLADLETPVPKKS